MSTRTPRGCVSPGHRVYCPARRPSLRAVVQGRGGQRSRSRTASSRGIARAAGLVGQVRTPKARLDDADHERREQRHPQRLEPSDERRSERRDDEERQRHRLERVGESRQQQTGRSTHEPRAEPGRRLDEAYRHAEGRRDLTVVGDRPVRRSELRVAEKRPRLGRNSEREDQRDDLASSSPGRRRPGSRSCASRRSAAGAGTPRWPATAQPMIASRISVRPSVAADFDERIASREQRPEDEPVEQCDDATEQHADDDTRASSGTTTCGRSAPR